MKNFPIPPILFYLSIILMLCAGSVELTGWNVPTTLYCSGWILIAAGLALSFSGSNLFKKKKQTSVHLKIQKNWLSAAHSNTQETQCI